MMQVKDLKKTRNDLFDNSWYNPGSSFKRTLWYYCNAIVFQSAFFPFKSLKVKLLRLFGAKVGEGVVIKPRVSIKYPWFLEIGNHVWIGEEVWIDNLNTVKIGDNACISQGALLLTGNHNYKREAFDLVIGKITLEEGVWIGAKTVVCPGVLCKSHALLAVGSVATTKLEPYSIYQGNPAVKVRDRVIR